MTRKVDSSAQIVELLRKSLIVQLGLAGVGQLQIRAIVGGSMNDINAIIKLVRSGQRGAKSHD
jgi:hypothetical protein